MQNKPLIDYFADGIPQDGTGATDEVRFTFGETDKGVVISVNEGEPVGITFDALFDLYIIAKGIMRHPSPVDGLEEVL